MSRSHHRHKRFKLRSLYVWHRYMGLSAALLVLIIAVTGVLLNHTEDFNFDSRFVQAEPILDWYGIEPPEQLKSFAAGEQRVVLLGEQLYLDQQLIPGDFHALLGATLLDGMLVVAADGDLLLLTRDGELIERLQAEDGVPASIEQLAVGSGNLLLARTAAGIYQSDSGLLTWTQWDGDATRVQWIRPTTPEPALTTALQQGYRAQILPLERLLLDLHSGRLFGRFGVWLFDAAAVLLILLALSGTLIWVRRMR